VNKRVHVEILKSLGHLTAPQVAHYRTLLRDLDGPPVGFAEASPAVPGLRNRPQVVETGRGDDGKPPGPTSAGSPSPRPSQAKSVGTSGQDRRVAAVDIFCGAGGLTRGLMDAGIEVQAGYDNDGAARYPYSANNGVPFIEADVRNLAASEVATVLGPEPNLLAGCAPCQPYSIMTNRNKGIADARAPLLTEFCRIVSGVLPTYVTVENVPGFAGSGVFAEFVSRLNQTGYFVDWGVLDAARYGVPQHRRRLVLLASKIAPIELPRPQRGRSPTVRGAIGKLPRLAAGRCHSLDLLHRAAGLNRVNLDRVRASSPGSSWRDWPEELKLKCQLSSESRDYEHSYGRMEWDAPSPPITTKFFNLGSGRHGHPEQNRALSLREGAILQSFPVGYSFCAPGKEIQLRTAGRLIGNAVPVRLAQAIGSAVVAHSAIHFGRHTNVESRRPGG
jgi:DNA (cytosine-5)-methyltransferase 1